MFLKSLKNQILFIFLLIIVLSIISTLISSWYFIEKGNLNSLGKNILESELILFNSITEQENFINFERTNEDFYHTKESDFISNFKAYHAQLETSLNKLDSSTNKIKGAKTTIQSIQLKNDQYLTLFVKLKNLMLKRGFKNDGLVGKMRTIAHQLEDSSIISLEDVLMLRRHEKDYIIRLDNRYLEKHEQLSKAIISKVKLDNNLSNLEKDKSLKLLNEYVFLFQELALFERMLGFTKNEGLKKTLILNSKLLLADFDLLNNQINDYKVAFSIKLKFLIICFWTLFLVIIFALAIKLSNRLSNRITFLSEQVKKLINSNFQSRIQMPDRKVNDEVGNLWKNFIIMENELNSYIKNFIIKVDEKTKELSEKNNQIEIQHLKIQKQKSKVELQNKDLLDGMKYGWRIQRALIPSRESFIKNVGSGFVHFSPKDIVSGDIYWVKKLKTEFGEELFFSVIDCTGHGVPGAFMSILAINALNDSIFRKKNFTPKKLIQDANNYVYSSMKYYVEETNASVNKDGMDLAFCKLNRSNLTLSYLGASRPLYIIRKKTNDNSNQINLNQNQYKYLETETCILFEVIPSKKTIGTLNKEEANNLDEHIIDIKENDFLYLFSDGFPDQFGGPRDKKFLIKRFRSLLMEIAELEPEVQKEILNNALLDWQGNNEQVDDICVMCIKV